MLNAVLVAMQAALLVLASLVPQAGFAQSTDFSDVVSLIKERKLDEAERRIDLVLSKEPTNVDALMYKGNILYYRGSNAGGIQLYGNEDESIYDHSMGHIGEGSSRVSPEAARQIAGYFKRALAQAPERMDIQLGLCWVYANAGMRKELIERFPALKKYGDKPGLQYNMGDYARIIADDHSFEDGMAVYREIARLYPQDGNIVNDMAAMYFKRGDLEAAMKYFTQASRMSSDEATLENLVLIYAVVGDYAKSARYLRQRSKLSQDMNYLLYDALKDRLAGASGWERDARKFIDKTRGDEKYKAYTAFAESLLPVSGAYSFSEFEKSKDHGVPTYFQIINYEWAAKRFPSEFGGVFALADVMTYYHNYKKALPFFARIEAAGLAKDNEEREALDFLYAWALYKTGRAEEANVRWKRLLDSKNFYRQSAASYFLGNYHYRRNDLEQAAAYFKRVKDEASKSKYANYSSNLYETIGKAK